MTTTVAETVRRISTAAGGGRMGGFFKTIVSIGALVVAVLALLAAVLQLYLKLKRLEAQVATLERAVKQQVGEGDIVQIVAGTMQRIEQERYARFMSARPQMDETEQTTTCVGDVCSIFTEPVATTEVATEATTPVSEIATVVESTASTIEEVVEPAAASSSETLSKTLEEISDVEKELDKDDDVEAASK